MMNRLVGWLWHSYAWCYNGLLSFYPYRQLLAQTAAQLAVQPAQRMLDVGCGTGNLLRRLLTGDKVTAVGVDRSAGMLAVARRALKPALDDRRLQLIEGDVVSELAKLPAASFDRIASVNLVYVLGPAERQQLWRQMLRLLAPGGRVVITTSVRTGSGAIIREHLRHAPWWQLLTPRLLGVFVIDSLINVLGNTGHFGFADFTTMKGEIEAAGGRCSPPIRCYGGAEQGVNVLFSIER